MIDSRASLWHYSYAMGHSLDTGIYDMLRSTGTHLEWALASGIMSKSFALNKLLCSANLHPMVM